MNNNIKELRIKKGVSRNRMANDIGISPISVYNYEIQKYNPSVEIIAKLLRYFDIDFNALFDLDSLEDQKYFDSFQITFEDII